MFSLCLYLYVYASNFMPKKHSTSPEVKPKFELTRRQETLAQYLLNQEKLRCLISLEFAPLPISARGENYADLSSIVRGRVSSSDQVTRNLITQVPYRNQQSLYESYQLCWEDHLRLLDNVLLLGRYERQEYFELIGLSEEDFGSLYRVIAEHALLKKRNTLFEYSPLLLGVLWIVSLVFMPDVFLRWQDFMLSFVISHTPLKPFVSAPWCMHLVTKNALELAAISLVMLGAPTLFLKLIRGLLRSPDWIRGHLHLDWMRDLPLINTLLSLSAMITFARLFRSISILGSNFLYSRFAMSYFPSGVVETFLLSLWQLIGETVEYSTQQTQSAARLANLFLTMMAFLLLSANLFFGTNSDTINRVVRFPNPDFGVLSEGWTPALFSILPPQGSCFEKKDTSWLEFVFPAYCLIQLFCIVPRIVDKFYRMHLTFQQEKASFLACHVTQSVLTILDFVANGVQRTSETLEQITRAKAILIGALNASRAPKIAPDASRMALTFRLGDQGRKEVLDLLQKEAGMTEQLASRF